MDLLHGKKILLGVSGGIAVYKAIDLTSKLTQKGADVKVVMTNGATKFVTPLAFQAISRNDVYTDTFDEKDPEKISHIDLADWADLIILAPATAHLIGRIANGLCDDLLTTILTATQREVLVAPAMNVNMYQNKAVQENLSKLASFGYKFIEPSEGYLACGYVGKGRLEEPINIIKAIEKHFEPKILPLKGKKVLISAGPTQETIDPVRYFTNRSSGKMGYAIAQVAMEMGAEVHLVSGPTSITPPTSVHVYQVKSADEMFEQITKLYNDMDIIIKSAAVADYRPKETFNNKLKKNDQNLVIEFERTKDILKYLGEHKSNQYLVGFAAETDHVLEYGKNKLVNKNLDAIVINDISNKEIGFQSDYNEVTFLTKSGKQIKLDRQRKTDVAYQLLTSISEELRMD